MNTTLRSTLGICALCVAILLGASAGALWAADSGANAAGDVAPVRNKSFRILFERTIITKKGPATDSMDSFWESWFQGSSDADLNRSGKSDGNTFKLFTKSDKPTDIDFRFCYLSDHTKGTVNLRVSDKEGGFIREFKGVTDYPDEDVLNKMKASDWDKLHLRIYGDLNRQAYDWIRNGARKK